MADFYFWGVDCGSTEIKAVASNAEGEILHTNKCRTLFPLQDYVRAALEGSDQVPSPFAEDGTKRKNHRIVVTGYGRSHLDFADDKLTEIKAHALGVQTQMQNELPLEYTIVDIGGQDSKIISIKNAEVSNFIINRKCAAGTGAYIEELAHRLQIPLESMNEIEKKHDKDLTLNSYCTVFAGQEVIRILMEGEKVENLLHALYQSVVKRVFEMAAITAPVVVFSGGVLSYHEPLRRIFAQKLKSDQNLKLAPLAQYCGAIGAAVYARK
jgi:predicted CoA-substrate-specific enzyme activase